MNNGFCCTKGNRHSISSNADKFMGTACRHVCLLLIMVMSGVEGAYTSTIGEKKHLYGRLDKPQIQKGLFTRTSCQWSQDDTSVMCDGKHLKRVPSDFPYDVNRLYLQKNEISALLNSSFEPYPNLVILDVSWNRIRTIKSGAFRPLKHLKSFHLTGNANLVIHSSVPFRPLEALVSLDMRFCNLKELPNDFMDWFPDLKYFDLSGNRLSVLNITRCRTGVRLKEVIIGGNEFQYLSSDTFVFVCPTESFRLILNPIRYISGDAISALPVEELYLGKPYPITPSMLFNLTSGVAMSSIRSLFVTEIELGASIPFEVFSPLRNHTLDYLAIDSSGDLSLYENIFSGIGCVRLDLTRNSIKNIEPEYFRGMSRLQSLLLMRNSIINFNPHNTTWESNIEHLDLTENDISVLYGYQFRGLSNLKGLNLSDNSELVVLDLHSYDGLNSLEIIDITKTSITRLSLSFGVSTLLSADLILSLDKNPFIPSQTFNSTLKLEHIDVSHSHLNRGNIWDSSISASLFKGLVKLLKLYLSNNPLGNLPDRVFEDNLFLAFLEIDNCAISSLSGNAFYGLKSLIYLNLNGNNLLILSRSVLTYTPILLILKINDNKLMSVEEGAMKRAPLLKHVLLSNNLLVSFNRSTWNTLMKYYNIDVSGNPFSCQCNFRWLRDLANTTTTFLRKNETLCSDDSLRQWRGKTLLEFDPSKYCVQNIVLTSTVPFGALALIIGLFLAFHNRWLIRYKLFLVKLAVIGYREMRDAREHDEFIFDVNIMFTEDDEEWAREHLRPTLEERLPAYERYSFGDEDLTLGMHYLEAVHYAVENSFKTILLLSRRAVRDNWFLIKFRTAMDHVHDELIENTVVIFLEDIPENEIPYLVRLYLSDRKPYMRWPEDVRGREYFWNELAKIVPFNLKYNPLIPPE